MIACGPMMTLSHGAGMVVIVKEALAKADCVLPLQAVGLACELLIGEREARTSLIRQQVPRALLAFQLLVVHVFASDHRNIGNKHRAAMELVGVPKRFCPLHRTKDKFLQTNQSI